MIISLHTYLKFSGFVCVDAYLKTLIRIDSFLIFLSILGKAWCELWHSSHNDILTPMSWCVSSGYFKNHWGLKLFLKCHRRSQNVYFFYLGGPILLLNIQVYSLEGVARRCSVKKTFLANFTKFTGKHLCQSLFFSFFAKACNFGTSVFLWILWNF